LTVKVYDASIARMSKEERSRAQPLDARKLTNHKKGWTMFDVSRSLNQWMDKRRERLARSQVAGPAGIFTLFVSVEDDKGRKIRPMKLKVLGRRAHVSRQSFLAAFFTEEDDLATRSLYHSRKRLKRKKRDTPQKREATLRDRGWKTDATSQKYSGNSLANSILPQNIGGQNIDNKHLPYGGAKEQQRRHSRTNKARKNRKRKKNRGQKYSPQTTAPPSENEFCRRMSLKVDFRKLNWEDWIVAPTHYTAFRCEGLCAFPLQNHMNATNHAIMQSLVSLIQQSSPHHHQRNHQEALSNPCCSPIDLDPITVLYFDDSRTVLYKKYKDMIVRSCGCH